MRFVFPLVIRKSMQHKNAMLVNSLPELTAVLGMPMCYRNLFRLNTIHCGTPEYQYFKNNTPVSDKATEGIFCMKKTHNCTGMVRITRITVTNMVDFDRVSISQQAEKMLQQTP